MTPVDALLYQGVFECEECLQDSLCVNIKRKQQISLGFLFQFFGTQSPIRIGNNMQYIDGIATKVNIYPAP